MLKSRTTKVAEMPAAFFVPACALVSVASVRD